MKTLVLYPILITLISLITCIKGNTCTTFCLRNSNQLVVGKNLDFYTAIGHVVINKRNVRKISFPIPSERPFEWISKNGSITFNQIGREFPYGGINEKGLVIEQMYLHETSYPEIDERYGLSELQWIQYQLDNAATVEEVLASDSRVRISKIATAPLHFLVADAAGNVATIEYLGGKMVYHTKSQLPICVLANTSYEKSKDYVEGLSNQVDPSGSLDRFAKASTMLRDFGDQDVIDYSFNILSAVSQGNFTRWSIVYDIKNRIIHYKTQNNRETRTLKVSDFDFSCHTPSLYINIDETMQNDKLNFLDYSYQKNREMMDVALNKIFETPEFKPLSPSEEERKLIAKYPETTTCK